MADHLRNIINQASEVKNTFIESVVEVIEDLTQVVPNISSNSKRFYAIIRKGVKSSFRADVTEFLEASEYIPVEMKSYIRSFNKPDAIIVFMVLLSVLVGWLQRKIWRLSLYLNTNIREGIFEKEIQYPLLFITMTTFMQGIVSLLIFPIYASRGLIYKKLENSMKVLLDSKQSEMLTLVFKKQRELNASGLNGPSNEYEDDEIGQREIRPETILHHYPELLCDCCRISLSLITELIMVYWTFKDDRADIPSGIISPSLVLLFALVTFGKCLFGVHLERNYHSQKMSKIFNRDDLNEQIIKGIDDAENNSFLKAGKRVKIKVKKSIDKDFEFFKKMLSNQMQTMVSSQVFDDILQYIPVYFMLSEYHNGSISRREIFATSMIISRLSRMLDGVFIYIFRLSIMLPDLVPLVYETLRARKPEPIVEFFDITATEEPIDVELLSIQNLIMKHIITEKVLIKDLNLSVCKGESLLIKGNNGCGKSSLFRIINDVYDRGSFNTESINNLDNPLLLEETQIRCVKSHYFTTQEPLIDSGKCTILEQIYYPNDVPEDPPCEKIEEVLNSLGLTKRHFKNYGRRRKWRNILSGGEKKMIAVARLVLREGEGFPDLVFLDEADANLHPARIDALYNTLLQHNITLVSISHLPYVEKYHKKFIEFGLDDEGRYRYGDIKE